VPVWMVASRWSARAGLWARIRDRAARMARVMLTRARSAADPVLRSRPPSPTAAASSSARNCISWRALAARTGSAHDVASASSSSSSRSHAGGRTSNRIRAPLGAAFLRSTECCLCGGSCGGRDPEVVEEALHADAEGFVVAVDTGPVGGFAAAAGAADASKDRCDDLVVEGEQGGRGPALVTDCDRFQAPEARVSPIRTAEIWAAVWVTECRSSSSGYGRSSDSGPGGSGYAWSYGRRLCPLWPLTKSAMRGPFGGR